MHSVVHTGIRFNWNSGNFAQGTIRLYGLKMPRYHNINGIMVQFTAEEETARDAEIKAWKMES